MSDATGSVRVTHHDRDGIWVIALAGEHDLATAPLLEARTLEIWPRCNLAIVDVSAATFIDSSLVNWLVRTRRSLEALGGSDPVRVVEDPQDPAVDLVFHTLAVRDTLPCYRTVQDAVAAMPATRLVRERAPGAARPQSAIS